MLTILGGLAEFERELILACPWRIRKSSQKRIGPGGLVSQCGDPSMIQSAQKQ
jgi:hypothetical protein